MPIFENENEIDDYLEDIRSTVIEVTKTFFSFSEIDYLRGRVVHYTPSVVQSLVKISYKKSTPYMYGTAKFVCTLFLNEEETKGRELTPSQASP